MDSLEKESVDAVVADPPFGIGFKYEKRESYNNPEEYWNWLEPIYIECLRILKPGGFIAFWQTQLYFKYFWLWFGEDIHIYCGCKNFVQLKKTPINYAYDPIIIKYKDGTPLRPNKPKRNLDFYVANTAKFVRQTDNIARRHPCPRPIDQVEELIRNFTLPGGLVLDPFIGSGTTMEACQKLGRSCIGIEINREYCNIVKERCFNRDFDDREVMYKYYGNPKDEILE